MSEDRATLVDEAFVAGVRALSAARERASIEAAIHGGTALTGKRALALLDSQMASRHLDLAARKLRASGRGFYTIGSSGHEGNAAIAEALRVDDPALLHYRSGAFFVHRASRVPGQTPLRDVLLGIVASREEPIAGGRHKVFGSATLAIPPQTSTIASHLPRAVGMAFGIERARKLGIETRHPTDAVVCVSFGDASVSHSTAAGAFHAACHASWQRLPMPILFVCEDNGLGISVPTPRGLVAETFSKRPGMRYFAADGCDLASAYDAARAAVGFVREERRPAFLHMRTVRMLGHAGSDLELAYRTIAEIRADEERDPVLATARAVIEAGLATPDEVVARYEAIRAQVDALAREVAGAPQLRDAADVMAPLAPRRPDRVAIEARGTAPAEARRRTWGDRLPEEEGPLPLAQHINRTLGDLLLKHREMLVFGEDVGRKGGVYGVTRALQRKLGVARVFDTLLDEQTIFGIALGTGLLGMMPVPEIQYLAYLHNAEDQLRGEAATQRFFSQGAYTNPLVVRIQGYAYQKGFGGHFHNDNGIAVLRDIPGIVIASPSRGDDASAMLRTCIAAARTDGTVCVFLEPIALYNTRDLYEDGDGLWLAPYDPDPPHVPIGAARTWGDGRDLLLVSFANGVPMSLRVARRLANDGIGCRVLDLRWLAPLPLDDLLREANAIGRVLVVDETRRSGGVSEGIVTALVDAGYRGALARVTSEDTFIPLGDAANLVLLGEEQIEAAARRLCAGASG